MNIATFKEVNEVAGHEFADCPLGKLAETKELDKPASEYDKPLCAFTGSPIEGNGGHWSGERGDSAWCPNHDEIPTRYNPNALSWEEILEKYHTKEIPFNEGEPDFSEVTKGDVTIDDFTESRQQNFTQADEKLAEQRGCAPDEVQKWRKENGYTWHECCDCQTIRKVPSEVHGNVSHYGGVAVVKNNGKEQ